MNDREQTKISDGRIGLLSGSVNFPKVSECTPRTAEGILDSIVYSFFI